MFSKYIRLINSVGENVSCYTCGNVFHWKKMQAGHGIGGRTNAILFMEEIVKPQCVGCNVFGAGKYAIFTRKLIDELGLERYDEIVRMSNTPVKYTQEDYQRIYDEYKVKVDELISSEDIS